MELRSSGMRENGKRRPGEEKVAGGVDGKGMLVKEEWSYETTEGGKK